MPKWLAAEKARGELRRHAVVCPNVTGRIKERIPQSKRARAGSLAVLDQPQMALTCTPGTCFFADVVSLFFGVTLLVFYLICFVSFMCFCAFIELAALRSIVLGYACILTATRI